MHYNKCSSAKQILKKTTIVANKQNITEPDIYSSMNWLPNKTNHRRAQTSLAKADHYPHITLSINQLSLKLLWQYALINVGPWWWKIYVTVENDHNLFQCTKQTTFNIILLICLALKLLGSYIMINQMKRSFTITVTPFSRIARLSVYLFEVTSCERCVGVSLAIVGLCMGHTWCKYLGGSVSPQA